MFKSALFKTYFTKRRTVSKLYFSVSNNEVVIPNRKYFKVTGKDAKKFLQGISTNDINTLKGKGTAIATAFLSPKGRVVADAIIYDLSDTNGPELAIETHSSVADSLASYMKSYKFRSLVAIDAYNLNTIITKDSNAMSNNDRGVCVVKDPRHESFGYRILIEPSSKILHTDKNYDYDCWVDGIAEGHDISGSIPLEANLDFLHYISFTKGCYIGQELVARTKYKGLVRKRLVPFHFTEASEPFPFDSGIRGSFDAKSIDSLNFVGCDVMIAGEAATTENPPGKIVSILNNQFGFALMRLEYLFSKNPISFLVSHPTGGQKSYIRFHRPSYWPVIDPQTGQKVDAT